MELSLRIQIAGAITNIDLGAVMVDDTPDIGDGRTITSAIMRLSVERPGLKGRAAWAARRPYTTWNSTPGVKNVFVDVTV